MSMVYLKYHKDDLSQKLCEPNMWLLVNQQALCIETSTFYERTITNQRVAIYKITPLTVQCQLQSTVWLLLELMQTIDI